MGLSTEFVVPKIHTLHTRLCCKAEFQCKNLWIPLVSGQSKRMCSRDPSILYQAHYVMFSSLQILAKILGITKILAKILKLISLNLVILQLTSICWKIYSHSGTSKGTILKKVYHLIKLKGVARLACKICFMGKRSNSLGTNVPQTSLCSKCAKLAWKAQYKR